MKHSFLIARRESLAYIRSPLGAAVVAGLLLIDGLLFYWFGLSQRLLSAEVLRAFFYNSSGVLMIAAVLLSMRTIAEERQTGTFTLLSTAPVREREIVIGKFLSAYGMVALLTLMTAYMPAMIFVNGKVSVGHILVGYLGLLLLGAASTAIGVFSSALVRSPIVAGIVAAAIHGVMILFWAVAHASAPPLKELVAAMSLHHNNQFPFTNGILQGQSVAYYVAVTYVFLLAASRLLEARRWR